MIGLRDVWGWWGCLVLAGLAFGLTACGADSESPSADNSAVGPPKKTAEQTVPPPAPPKAIPPSSAAAPDEGTDGTLTAKDGRRIRDWGPKQDRERTLAIFTGMVEDFRAGRMADVCKWVSDFQLYTFPRGSSDPEAPCTARMEQFAATLERQGRAPQPLKLLWVRAYTLVSGVWVEDERGRRYRVPFGLEENEWKMELGVFRHPEVLNAELIGPG